MDRFADAVIFAGAAREARALRGVRTLTMELDSAAVFWRATPPREPGAFPFLDCRLVDPTGGIFEDVFCSTTLRFTQPAPGSDSAEDNDYAIAYHARTWSGRPTHAFTVTGPDGGPIDDETESFEMWLDAETLALVLVRSTGREGADGTAPFTFSYERGDLRTVKGLTVAHFYRTTLYGAAPAFLAGFTDEEHAEMALVAEALEADDVEAARGALPPEAQDTFGFYAAILGNAPLEVEYRLRAVRFNRPLPPTAFGGFAR